MEVQERMTRDPVTIRTGLTARTAAELMRSRKIRHLPVVDEEGKLVGIVTDRDIRQIVFSPAVRARFGDLAAVAEQISVDEIMTTPVATTTRYADLADAAKIMHERRIGALLVVQRDRVVGILTEDDVLKAFAEMTGRTLEARPDDW